MLMAAIWGGTSRSPGKAYRDRVRTGTAGDARVGLRERRRLIYAVAAVLVRSTRG